MKGTFHLALPCLDIQETKDFYTRVLKASSGREAANWVDINFGGHQITFSKVGDFDFNYPSYRFEEAILPSFHFGVVVDIDTWQSVYKELVKSSYEVTAEVEFLTNKAGEHISFFIKYPNGYSIEFKSFSEPRNVFSKN